MNEKHLSHAYMIVGPESERRDRAAADLAAAILCPAGKAPCMICRDCRKVYAGIHPDVVFIRRLPSSEKGQFHREILVDQIRQMTADAVIAPNDAEHKIYIIAEADRMNIPAQNALLKALEDPPGHAAFLLCTTAADALLPTIRSRCVRLDDTDRTPLLTPLSDLAKAYLDTAAAGDPGDITLFCMLRCKLSREEAEDFLSEIIAALGDILCGRRSNPGLTREHIFYLSALFGRAQDYLRHNVSPKQIFGMLAAETLR